MSRLLIGKLSNDDQDPEMMVSHGGVGLAFAPMDVRLTHGWMEQNV